MREFPLTFHDIENTISVIKANYKTKQSELKVIASSDYGAYADLHLEGFGPMNWDAADLLWTLKINGLASAVVPETVVVIGPEGYAQEAVAIK